MNEFIYAMGVDNRAGYRMLHHVGSLDEVQASFDAMASGAKRQGFDPKTLFLMKYPLDDAMDIEELKIPEDFIIWFNEEVKRVLDGSQSNS